MLASPGFGDAIDEHCIARWMSRLSRMRTVRGGGARERELLELGWERARKRRAVISAVVTVEVGQRKSRYWRVC